ncbi:acyltransferase-domain-containing protein [Suillus bovinus]|uniref:acyltransferase-domain-containing protein n=1 Tax=Suillus bovinus TaxID=48563 RepID=UPI001B85E3C4|nr:acyltransferase-domain-containing protein [Suillus bovinus]KAG2146540.1 acyltransferase-domain-containing protein [Suillus bovinus]
MTVAARQHELPIFARPPKTWAQTFNGLFFFVFFIPGCLMLHGFQLFILLPLKLFSSSPQAWKLYEEGIRYTKGAFATLMNLMNQWFAPTRLSITFERVGPGKFSEDEIKHIVERDASGRVVALRLPSKTVVIANHQVYSDWWYVWCLTYFMGTHKDVFIVLKNSLKWVPLIGPAMQIFRFIFLARSWASDRIQLSSKLAKLGRQAEQEDKPFTFILFPEGTLVSKDTRPISRKYADKLGVPDPLNILLPRSTGLHYCLRSLVSRVPSLKLIDITMVYPGIPPKGYGQSFYTLRSIFCDRVPPPIIHMHLRIFDVAKDVPIGDISGTSPAVTPNGTNHEPVEVDFPEQEKTVFDEWLRKLWMDKDEFITTFHHSDSFPSGHHGAVEIPLELGSKREIPVAFCFFVPVVAYVLWSKLVQVLL